MRYLLALLMIVAAAPQCAAQYDEKMGRPEYPYKSFKEFIPVMITRLADSSIIRRACGKEDDLQQKGYRFFNLCMYAQDHYYTYLRQSEEDGTYSVVTKDQTLHSPARAEEIRAWLLKKKNGIPVTYAAYTLQRGDYDIEHYLLPLALKGSRDGDERAFLNYGINIGLDPKFDKGLITYHIYPINNPADLGPDKHQRCFPDCIALLQYILGAYADNFARIRSRQMREDGRYPLCVHSPDVASATLRLEGAAASILIVPRQLKGKAAARFAEMAAAMKAARWPGPFTATVEETEKEKSCRFVAKDASGKTVHPLTFSLKYGKESDLVYVTVRSAE